MGRARSIRLLGLLLALSMLAAACSRVPPGGELTYTFGPVAQGGGGLAPGDVAGDGFELLEGDADAGTGLATGPGGNAGGTTGTTGTTGPAGSPGSPGTTASGSQQGQGPAAPGNGGGGQPAPGGGTAVTGVDGNTVKIVFHSKLESCGGLTQQNNMNDEGRDMIRQFVGWFNDEVLADYGWQLEHEIVDDGGYLCAEKTRAAAQHIIRELQPFAVLGLSATAEEGPLMADLVSRAGIPHIGINFNTYDELNERKGYLFNAFITAQLAYEYLEAYIVGRVRDTQTANPTTGVPEDRVYGMAVADIPEYRKLAGVMKQRLAAHDIDVAHFYFVSTDPGVAGQTALTIVNKMRNDGVNSLIFDFFPNGFLSGVALTQNMARQNYLPELLIATYGIPIIDQTNDLSAWERAHGVSPFSTLALRSGLILEDGQAKFDPQLQNVAENTEAYLDVWRERLGNNTDTSETQNIAAANLFQFLSVLAVGLMGNPYDEVGGRLTRESFANAVFETAAGGPRRCAMWRLLGRDSPYHYHYSQDAGLQNGFHNRYTTVYWVNRNTLATLGYYESYDNYEFFDGFEDLPAQGSRDTGREGMEHYYQEPIGLRPWIPCGQLGMDE